MDFFLKQRLVGAIVLVALGVIFIPMLLEGPNRTLVPEMEALPEPGGQQLSQSLDAFPAPGEVPAEPDESVVLSAPDAEAEAEPRTQPEQQPLKSEPEPQPKPEPEPETPQVLARPEPAPPPQAVKEKQQKPGPLGNWVVQAGSFSSEPNALRLRDKLRAAGFATQVEKVRVDGKSHFRVRVGPFLERADADKSRKKMQDKLAIKGRVLSYP